MTWFTTDSKSWFSRLFQNFTCEKYTIFPEHKPEKYIIFPENNIFENKINKFMLQAKFFEIGVFKIPRLGFLNPFSTL